MPDKSDEKRVATLHERMGVLRRRQEQRRVAVLGTVCACVAVCLVLLIAGEGISGTAMFPGEFSGATILFEGVGGYVLAAILAFTLGVIITVICLKNRKKK